IEAPAGSGVIGVNGAAAHKAAPGDLLIICTYAAMPEAQARAFRPALVYVDAANRLVRRTNGRLAAV
ncbi:MAG: aspartate 1-decarboxylase, partial [Mariprofundaceae bacterium]